tara:strand:- start:3071 stop:4447 length:1377 start_codon:yes stop_codon:yes gene_type:complete
MSAFNTILEKVTYGSFNTINDPNLTFQEQLNYFSNHISGNGVKYYLIKDILMDKSVPISKFSNFITEKKSSKFDKLLYALNNMFIAEKDKLGIIELFSKAEKAYLNFNKFAFLFKWKKAKYGCTTDMYMNDITENDKNVITILHCNNKYLFTIMDIRKILNNSLNECMDFYHTPIPCKNPYNNIPFSKAHLLHFYLSIKVSNYIIPEIFNSYFLCNFSLKKLVTDYEYNARKDRINILTKKQDFNEKVEYIHEMIACYNTKHEKNKIRINREFPVNELITIFEPYLKYYYKSLYSLCDSTKDENTLFIDALLYNFQKFNPKFGRRIIKRNLFGKTPLFINKHIPFKSPRNYNLKNEDSHMYQVKCIAPFVKEYVQAKNNKDSNDCFNINQSNQTIFNHYQNSVQQVQLQVLSNQSTFLDDDQDSEDSEDSDSIIITVPDMDRLNIDSSDEELETESVS